MFTDSTTMVDNEPLNGLNEDITNPYVCEQTLNVSAGTLNLSVDTSFNPKEERLRVWLLKKLMSKNQVPQGIHNQEQSPNIAQGVKEQQQRVYFDDPCHKLLHKVYISQGSSSNVFIIAVCCEIAILDSGIPLHGSSLVVCCETAILDSGKLLHGSNTMAEENVPFLIPTRSDEQILPFNSWLLIGKGNLLLDLQKLQKNHISYIRISVVTY
ncbi:hypothetical protein Tco_1009105, partial [Tanacetum coccineum]